jgi:hypothetical protein
MEGRRFTNAEELNSNSRQFKDWFHLSGFVSSQGICLDLLLKEEFHYFQESLVASETEQFTIDLSFTF